jgi:hypothetical protein
MMKRLYLVGNAKNTSNYRDILINASKTVSMNNDRIILELNTVEPLTIKVFDDQKLPSLGETYASICILDEGEHSTKISLTRYSPDIKIMNCGVVCENRPNFKPNVDVNHYLIKSDILDVIYIDNGKDLKGNAFVPLQRAFERVYGIKIQFNTEIPKVKSENSIMVSYESRDDCVIKTTTIVEIFKKIA